MNVVRYHRVSTEHQSLERQTQATEEYVENEFDDPKTWTLADADTGTDTDRESYQRMMQRVEWGNIDAVVVKDMTRIARSVRDLTRTVDKMRELGTELHFVDEPFTVTPDDDDPMQDFMIQMLGAMGEFEAKITQQRVREGIAARQESDEYHHGPAPLGFEKDDGMLLETEQYDQICAVLDMVKAGELSQRKAAQRLDTSRKTVRNCINERPELYGLGGGE